MSETKEITSRLRDEYSISFVLFSFKPSYRIDSRFQTIGQHKTSIRKPQ